jgi:hypothetical protein
MAPEPISTPYFINPSYHFVCLYMYFSLIARQRLGKRSYRGNEYTRNDRRIVGPVILYAVRVLLKGSRRLIIPRIYCCIIYYVNKFIGDKNAKKWCASNCRAYERLRCRHFILLLYTYIRRFSLAAHVYHLRFSELQQISPLFSFFFGRLRCDVPFNKYNYNVNRKRVEKNEAHVFGNLRCPVFLRFGFH